MLAQCGEERIEPWPGGEASCPCCKSPVRAKCGEIVIWHWAHESADCDPWAEPESVWHAGWKSRYPSGCREVVIGAHRADIKLPNGWVIELQNSSISPSEIIEREQFYKRMIWIINAQRFEENLRIRDRGHCLTFKWKWPRKVWQYARCPLFFDLGNVVCRVCKIHWHEGGSAGGWMRPISIDRLGLRDTIAT